MSKPKMILIDFNPQYTATILRQFAGSFRKFSRDEFWLEQADNMEKEAMYLRFLYCNQQLTKFTNMAYVKKSKYDYFVREEKKRIKQWAKETD